jgi:PIN domain nuclease of toxin-antitoxin system
MQDILIGKTITVLPITAEIPEFSKSAEFIHGDPFADRLVAATSLAYLAALISLDEKTSCYPKLALCLVKFTQLTI